MKITALKQQIKNPDRVSVFVDEQYSFSLSLDELVKYKLKNTDELNAADVKKFKKISADGKLRARTLEWLINRPHSERELRNYLYKKKTDPEQTDALIEEFTKRGYLNDAKFAVWFSELQARRGHSNRAITSELFAKGIDREIISQVLEDQEDDEAARLQALITKKQSLSRYKNDPLKLLKYLTSQGFAYQMVKEQLKINQPDN